MYSESGFLIRTANSRDMSTIGLKYMNRKTIKGLIVSRLVAFVQFPIGATYMLGLPEASSKSYYMSAKRNVLWRDCASVQARMSLCWPPM